MSDHVGTRSRYVEGCRCELCTKENRDYQRHYMSSRYRSAPPSPKAWFVRRAGYVRNDGRFYGSAA